MEENPKNIHATTGDAPTLQGDSRYTRTGHNVVSTGDGTTVGGDYINYHYTSPEKKAPPFDFPAFCRKSRLM